MVRNRVLRRGLFALAVLAVACLPAGATTLVRMGLEDLVATNASVVRGRVIDVESRWNDDHTFMLTDVRFAADDVLKGARGDKEITVTIMGGTVGDLTTMIVGGPELTPGREYVLFLNREALPGAPGALTVRDLCQGVFDVVRIPGGDRAISQATRHPLLAGPFGETEAPGGGYGLSLADMTRDVRRMARP